MFIHPIMYSLLKVAQLAPRKIKRNHKGLIIINTPKEVAAPNRAGFNNKAIIIMIISFTDVSSPSNPAWITLHHSSKSNGFAPGKAPRFGMSLINILRYRTVSIGQDRSIFIRLAGFHFFLFK